LDSTAPDPYHLKPRVGGRGEEKTEKGRGKGQQEAELVALTLETLMDKSEKFVSLIFPSVWNL